MVDLKATVYNILETALGETPVHYFYPATFNELPCVSWYEIENQRHSQADGVEYLSSVAFQIDIWSRSAMTNGETALTIDEAMTSAGFRRGFAHDLYEIETGIHHKTMRYQALSTQDQTLYQ